MSKVIFWFPPDFRSVGGKAVPPSAALAPPAGQQGCNTSAVASGGLESARLGRRSGS